MTYHAQLGSPLGRILLCADGAHLTGLYFVGQKDCPAIAGLAPVQHKTASPASGTLDGRPIRLFKAYRSHACGDLFSAANLARTEGDPAQQQRKGQASSLCDAQEEQSNAHTDANSGADDDEAYALRSLQPGTPPDVMAIFLRTRDELAEYFDGTRQMFSVPLLLEGSAFQKKVWRALLDIPYGEYVSYGDIAVAVGMQRKHARPVGTAVGQNPITIIVPCHRVLAGSGRLNGYTGGLDRKLALLQREGFDLH
ncbi:methylated-DNA--[protein]-cysteine S-methyltransferase [Allopusillimonas soli]